MGTSQLTRDQDIKFELENVMYQRLSRTLLGIHLSASRGRVSRSCPPLFRGQSRSARWRRKGRNVDIGIVTWLGRTIRSVFRFIVDLDLLCYELIHLHHSLMDLPLVVDPANVLDLLLCHAWWWTHPLVCDSKWRSLTVILSFSGSCLVHTRRAVTVSTVFLC